MHYPETREIWSYGSGYGGNALLGKKCLALRIALHHGPRPGLAGRAHADPGRDQPQGQVPRGCRFPQRLRQDQLLDAGAAGGRLSGWKVTTIGDDIAWIKPHADGKLVRHQPEAGYFGVAPGGTRWTNPTAWLLDRT